jgi:mRNA interferase MazF
MAVTSQVRAVAGIGEIPILEWKASGLLKPSVLKPILFTVDRLLILKMLGTFGDSDKRSLRQSLTTILEVATG